ncbi:vitamin K epoxide reductase family protein [Thermodesulfobacteriota bacterium]
MKQTRLTNPFPYYVYLWAVVFLTLVGLADSIYLAISHYRVYTDVGYKSFCALSRAINCDTVSQSPYAIMLNVPVAIWGAIGYSFIFLLLFLAGSKNAGKVRIWSLIFWVTLIFSGHSVILALISSYLIRSYCILCIVSYGVNLGLLFYAWLIRRRFSNFNLVEDTLKDILFLWENKVKSILLFGTFFAAVILTWALYPVYWNFQPPRITADIPTGITASGYPWIGAENAVLEISEFADYQCFQCKKMHFFLRRLMTENPGKIKIIHRHYPMDHEFNPIVRQPFHVGSSKLAMLAVYAASKNKFWEMNDLLYGMAGKKKPISTKELAKALSLDSTDLARALNDRTIRLRVKHDIYSGNKRGITGTPAYVIDGEIYQGQIPPEIIRKILE